MSEIPDNIDLQWVGRHLLEMRDDMRGLRRDIDMLTRIVLRVDNTLDALREDVKSLWLGQGDLRRRIETLEAK